MTMYNINYVVSEQKQVKYVHHSGTLVRISFISKLLYQ